MTNMVRNIRSTLNFFVAMLELFIATMLAIKVFLTDVSSEIGLVGYILDFFGMMGGQSASLSGVGEARDSVFFLVTILIFMVFGQALFLAVPSMLERDRRKKSRANRHQYFIYRKKRFIRNRFFIR
jgi:hypothetical protein